MFTINRERHLKTNISECYTGSYSIFMSLSLDNQVCECRFTWIDKTGESLEAIVKSRLHRQSSSRSGNRV